MGLGRFGTRVTGGTAFETRNQREESHGEQQ